MNLLKKKNRAGSMFPSVRKSLFQNRLMVPSFFDFDMDLFNEGSQMPLANLRETNKEYKVEMSVPGCKKDDFDISIDNGMLTISSEKQDETKDEDNDYVSREFSYSSFSRSFDLPENVEESKISAHYDNGMLEVTIPKKEGSSVASRKQIKVQ